LHGQQARYVLMQGAGIIFDEICIGTIAGSNEKVLAAAGRLAGAFRKY